MIRTLLLALCTGCLFAAEVTQPYTMTDVDDPRQTTPLSEDREWLTLLHVERSWFGVRRSLVDDPAFFLAADGKFHPAAELRATLAALIAPPPAEGRNVFDRFPARCEFLIRRLALDRRRLPVPRSQEFETAYAGLNPRSVAMAFPTAYMNTPASMFGHTLLVIRSHNTTGMSGQAINYAAVTGHDGGAAFALKGLFGGYPGLYSLMPYWEKLKEYSDTDQRDVWEYELSLSQEEVRRLLLHVWEMRGIAADYWFMDENCAYLLLYLIDAARPELRLHEQVSSWVIPLDTVRVIRAAGLVDRVSWRASLATKVAERAARLPDAARERARRIALGEVQPSEVTGDPAAVADELDLATDYLQALRNRQRVSQTDFRSRFVPILTRRSSLDVISREASDGPHDVAPDLGHGSLRVGFGGGSAGDAGFVEFSIRPAYHDLLDPAPGYVPGAQIDFTNLVIRSYQGEQRPTVERLDLIGLRSYSARDDFFHQPSWRVDTGFVRERIGATGSVQHHAFVDYGVGAAWLLPHSGLVYALGTADLRVVNRDFQLGLGLGPEVGAVLRIGDNVALNPSARWESFIGEARADNWRIGLRGSVTIHRDLALAFDLSRRRTWDFLSTEMGMRVFAYF
ncbi:MAG: DUF4105 domain-containing protein [Planctomycetota bacterium]